MIGELIILTLAGIGGGAIGHWLAGIAARAWTWLEDWHRWHQ